MVNTPAKLLRPGDRIKQSFLRKPSIRSARTRSQKAAALQVVVDENAGSPKRSPFKAVNGNVPPKSATKKQIVAPSPEKVQQDGGVGSAVSLWESILEEQLGENETDLKELLVSKIKASKFNYKDRISQQEDLIKKLKRALKDTITRQTKLAEKGPILKTAIATTLVQATCEAAKLRSQLETEVEAKTTAEKLADETQQAVAAKEEALCELEGKLSEAESQVATHVQTISEKDALVTDAHTRISEREHQLNATRSELEQTKIDRENIASRLASTTKEFEASIASVKSEKETIEGLVTTLEAKQAELTENRNELQTQLVTAENVAETQKQRIEELQKELNELKESHAREANAAAEQLAQVREEATASSTTLEMQKTQLETAKSELDGVKANVTRLTEQLERATEDVREGKDRYEKLQTKLDAREEQFTETIKSFNANQEAQLKQIASLTEEKNAAVTEVSVVKDDNTTLLVEAGRIREEVSALRRQADAFTQEINGLREANEELVTLRLKLSTEVQFLRSENARLSEHEAAVTAELSTIKGHMEDASVESLQDVCDLQREKAILEERLKEAEKGSVASNEEIEALRVKCESLTKDRLEAENMRRKLHNEIQELKGKVRVMVRVRPLVGSEDENSANTLKIPEDTRINLTGNGRRNNFTLDHVFPSHATQSDVFAEVNHFVQSALDGYKVCLFAYGQTGSGKTYTMQGIDTPESRGMIPRAIAKILATAESAKASGWEYTMEASYIEIYNETLRDLLREKGKKDEAIKHMIKHEDGNTRVTNATYVPITSTQDVDNVMKRAVSVRSVAKTNMNDQSSRSHAVFTLNITGRNSQSNQVLEGSLNLVDLAGSERVAKSGATGARLKEAAMINKSLSSLGDVFQSLAKGNNHVPFRNSKLTYLLQPCLSGEGKTLMLVNCSPADDNAPETLCSLRFASLVNSCELGKAKQNKKFERKDIPGTPSARPQTAPAGEPPAKRRR